MKLPRRPLGPTSSSLCASTCPEAAEGTSSSTLPAVAALISTSSNCSTAHRRRRGGRRRRRLRLSLRKSNAGRKSVPHARRKSPGPPRIFSGKTSPNLPVIKMMERRAPSPVQAMIIWGRVTPTVASKARQRLSSIPQNSSLLSSSSSIYPSPMSRETSTSP